MNLMFRVVKAILPVCVLGKRNPKFISDHLLITGIFIAIKKLLFLYTSSDFFNIILNINSTKKLKGKRI